MHSQLGLTSCTSPTHLSPCTRTADTKTLNLAGSLIYSYLFTTQEVQLPGSCNPFPDLTLPLPTPSAALPASSGIHLGLLVVLALSHALPDLAYRLTPSHPLQVACTCCFSPSVPRSQSGCSPVPLSPVRVPGHWQRWASCPAPMLCARWHGSSPQSECCWPACQPRFVLSFVSELFCRSSSTGGTGRVWPPQVCELAVPWASLEQDRLQTSSLHSFNWAERTRLGNSLIQVWF